MWPLAECKHVAANALEINISYSNRLVFRGASGTSHLACHLRQFGRAGHALTVLIAAAGCAVLPFWLAGAAVGSRRRRGRSSTGSSTFTFIQETVHIISTQQKEHIQRCPRHVKYWRHLYKNIPCVYRTSDSFPFYTFWTARTYLAKLRTFKISCGNWPTYGLSTATTDLLTSHCIHLTQMNLCLWRVPQDHTQAHMSVRRDAAHWVFRVMLSGRFLLSS